MAPYKATDSKKKALFFSPYVLWPDHLEVDVELATKLLANDFEVIFATCNGKIKACDANPYMRKETCFLCQNKFSNSLKASNLRGRISTVGVPDARRPLLSDFDNVIFTKDFLKNFHIDGIDIGSGVLSSVISILRDPNPDLNAKHRDLVTNLLDSAISIMYSFRNTLDQIAPDVVYIFNGRFALLRPVLRLCQKRKLKCFVHERAGFKDGYAIFEDTYPHDLEFQKKQLQSFFVEGDFPSEEKYRLGERWFLERRGGAEQGWISFNKDQTRNNLPENFDKEKFNVVIFNSSEDEFESISGWENPLYKTQNEGVRRIATDLKGNKNIRLYLRVHPNLGKLGNVSESNSQVKEIYNHMSDLDNLHVIEADQKIDSYALLESADLVVTFGSTVGVEAAYWGKPSILAGRSIYEDLDAVIKPRTHDELIALVETSASGSSFFDLKKAKLDACKYSYYVGNWGHTFSLFNAESIGNYTIKNSRGLIKRLAPQLHAKAIYKIVRMLRNFGVVGGAGAQKH